MVLSRHPLTLPRSLFWNAVISATALLAFLGCASIKVGLGMRVRLEKLSLTSMDITLPAQGIAPGEKQPLVVTFQKTDGSRVQTEGEGKGVALWDDLRITTTIGTVNRKGMLLLPADPRLSYSKMPHITVTAPSHPDLRAELDVPVRYDRPFLAQFSGHNGLRGSDGSSGLDGSNGSSGSTDPDNPSPGGNGGDGSSGGDGQDGGSGEDGPNLQVYVALRPGSRPLLQVVVNGAERREYFLVDPQGGTLTVKADGGSGGGGGSGGRGGRGGSGGWGSPSGNSGSDGSSGRDGHSGTSGKAGTITVYYDRQAALYLKVIQFSNRDGNGKSGPAVILVATSVPPLW